MIKFQHNLPQNKIKILDFTYTSQPSINQALPLKLNKIRLAFFIVSCICTFGFVWLLARWSAKKKSIMMYTVCSVQQATAFLIEEEDLLEGSEIVQRSNKFDIKRKTQAVSFVYHDRNFLYHEEKDVFLPIRYEELGLQLDKLQKGKFEPYSRRGRKRLLDYYGMNEIKLNVQNYFEVFIQEMLTPYEVFQLYAIILWLTQQYYIFPIILLIYSLFTYWDNSRQVVNNQKKLAQRSYFQSVCKVATKKKNKHQSQVEQKANNSQDFTIIEEIKTHIEEVNEKKNFDLVQIFHTQKISSHSSHQTSKQEGEQGSSKQYNIQLQTIQSRKILPGDIIILGQGDVVPCDCVLISGEAIFDQSYTSGQNHLMRKIQLDNYDYNKERETNFLLNLGTKIIKVKSRKQLQKQHINHEMVKKLLNTKQIACLVTQTNYNTQRGKYLRAIRHQKKPIDNFTRQSIYFIYVIILITVIAFIVLFPKLNQIASNLSMFFLFIDLLATSIPITLPTALSVGINFAQHRLSKTGIHSILPSNIIAGGRATTIVIDSNKVLSKNYQVASIVVGVKSKSVGTTYSSLAQFLDLKNNITFTQSFYNDPYKKNKQINKISQSGRMLIRAFSSCHSLQIYNNQLSGTTQQKNLFQFAQTKIIDEDRFQSLGVILNVKQRIYFKQKEKKYAVIVQMLKIASCSEITNQHKEQFLQQQMNNIKQSLKIQQEQANFGEKNKIIFIKGTTETIVKICKQHSYPANYNEYLGDISEKGYKVVSYAYKIIPQNYHITKNTQLNEGFTFCGFALLQSQKKQDTIQTFEELKQAKMQILFISQQKQLQASSLALSNQLCTKKELILCDIKNGIVKCSGSLLQWESNQYSNGVNQLIMQSESLLKNSYLCLSSKLYQELFMKRDEASSQIIFNKAIIYSQMENRHIRNVYFQLDRKGKVTFAVGSGANVSQCAHLSMQLQRGQCSMLSSFHTNQKSLKCITQCLIICRAALATNFHSFSMMILFSMVQFTTTVALYFCGQTISNFQMLYEDLIVTFPIFVTINMTSPVSRLSRQLPPKSFFSFRPLASMIGQFVIQLITQLVFVTYVANLRSFKDQMQRANQKFYKTSKFVQTSLSLATFVLSNYLYLGIVLSTSVSKPFRKPFYTNPYYLITLILLWLFNTAIVLLPEIVPDALRPEDLTQQIQQILVMAMLLGNLIMILMFIYENLLFWVTSYLKKQKKNFILQSDFN